MTLPDIPDALPLYNLDALRAEITALLAFKVKPIEIKAMLLRQDAPPSAWLEALVVMGQPSSPMRIAKALCDAAATRSDLLPGVAKACQRWGVHPASLVGLWTRGPLGLGLALGLPENLVRSFPSKRRARTETGLWAPPPDFLGPKVPEDLVLQELRLCDQPRLERLPDRIWIGKRLTLDRLPHLSSYGPALSGFEGALGIRDCRRLPGLPPFTRLSSLVVDGQPWSRFPEAPLEARQIALHRMEALETIDPTVTARKLILTHCPRLQELPLLPNLAEVPKESLGAPRHLLVIDSWMLDPGSSQYGVTLTACHALRELPPGFRVPGTLLIQDCWGLEALPPDLQVRHLVLRRLPGLRRLPEGLRVHGHLILDGLAALESLPDGLTVDGDLVVHQMPHTLALPKDLVVKGSLRIHPSDAALPWPDRPRVFSGFGTFEGL
jgi:hypothetical protein